MISKMLPVRLRSSSTELSDFQHTFEVNGLSDGSMSCNHDNSPIAVKVFSSADTDIGGMERNEDDYFIWQHRNCNNVVLGVFDGHGSDTGKFASNATKIFMTQWMDEKWPEMTENLNESFRAMFLACHEYLRTAFKEYLVSEGYEVRKLREYLVKRKRMIDPWVNVHGGTTATIIVICNGKHIITANVGDSSAMMLAKGKNVTPEDFKLQYSKEPCLEDESLPECNHSPVITTTKSHDKDHSLSLNSSSREDLKPTENNTWLIMTAGHSPESYSEFIRFRDSHPSSVDPSIPHILMIYDSPQPIQKSKCNPIFDRSCEGKVYITGKGGYYKNVRHEWASLISTPPEEMHQSALAFTRSLGDFHMHRYGVICEPPVKEYTVDVLYDEDQRHNLSVACLILCTDGIWDNWHYDEISNFFLNDSTVQSVHEVGSCKHIITKFMEENTARARNNFGDQADNATAVVTYILISS